MSIVQYVIDHTERGECNCGKCLDRGEKPDPTGHVADLVFFKVAATNSPTAEEFTRLAKEHAGDFCECDPFDGNEHGYMELGGWIGDQGLAMQFMGLGSLLGVFTLVSPKMFGMPDELALQMAGGGFLAIQAKTVLQPA